MRHSEEGILTSHAGSLPRPDSLIERNRTRQSGETTDEETYQAELAAAVPEVVARRTAAGITVPGDGEYGKSMGQKVNYGAWWSYAFDRLSGLEALAQGADIATRRLWT